MDSTYYMTIAALGAQEEYDTQIVKQVWNEDNSNFTETEAGNNCEAAYEKQGASVYNKCRAAGISCGKDAACNAMATKYAAALTSGYSKDFETFKKKTNGLAAVGEIGGAFLSGILDRIGGRGGSVASPSDSQDYIPTKKSNTGLYIGIGLVAVVGIGVAIYYGTKK